MEHQHQCEGKTKPESLHVRCQERLPRAGYMFFTRHLVTKIAQSFYKFWSSSIPIHFKTYVTTHRVYLHVSHPLFFQVFMNSERTTIAIHSFYFPLYIFHKNSALFSSSNAFSKREVGGLLQILLQKYSQTKGLPIKQLIILYTPLQNHKYLCRVTFIYKLNDIKEIARRFWRAIDDKKVIAFHGAMASGKTTFIHALCEVKGVSDVVGSPTFSIINEYSFSDGYIFHIDLYRLKDEQEAIRAGVEDCLYSDHLCFVEWPEKAPGIFPPDAVHVFIEVIDSETRHLTIQDK